MWLLKKIKLHPDIYHTYHHFFLSLRASKNETVSLEQLFFPRELKKKSKYYRLKLSLISLNTIVLYRKYVVSSWAISQKKN